MICWHETGGGNMGRKFGLSFSWRRATGLASAKGRISRQIGIPLTRSGRERKIGRLVGSFGIPFLVSNSGQKQNKTIKRFESQRQSGGVVSGCLSSFVKLIFSIVVIGVVIAFFENRNAPENSATISPPPTPKEESTQQSQIRPQEASPPPNLSELRSTIGNDTKKLSAAENDCFEKLKNDPKYTDAVDEKETASIAVQASSTDENVHRLTEATQALWDIRRRSLDLDTDVLASRAAVATDETQLALVVPTVAQQIPAKNDSSTPRSSTPGNTLTATTPRYANSGSGETYVRSYTRRDGTHVSGYFRH